MLIENLHEGQEIKNYKELCKILQLPVKAGNSKKSQLNDLSRYCEIEKDGNKFLIRKIYSRPKAEKTVGNRGIYIRYIQGILLNYFLYEEKTKCTVTKNQIWKILGVINDNYNLLYGRKLTEEQLRSIEERLQQKDLDEFYFRTRNKLYRIIDRALDSLDATGLIDKQEELVAVEIGEHGYKKYTVVRNNDVRMQIKTIKYESLQKVGCSFIEDLFDKGPKAKDNYLKYEKQMLKEQLGYDYVFTRYLIQCKPKYLKMGIQDVEKRLLNSAVIRSVDTHADRRFEKNMEKYMSGKTRYMYSPYYPMIQRVLSQKLLNLDAESLDYLFETKDSDIEGEIDGIFDNVCYDKLLA